MGVPDGMEKKKYSIKEVQNIVQILPTALQDLLKKNQSHLKLEVVRNEKGEEEVFLDPDSLQRILFLKQLELRQKLTPQELLTQISEGEGLLSEKKGTGVNALNLILDGLVGEVQNLNDNLENLISRYHEVSRELKQFKCENMELRREMDSLKVKHNLLLEEISNQLHGAPEKKEEIIN